MCSRNIRSFALFMFLGLIMNNAWAQAQVGTANWLYNFCMHVEQDLKSAQASATDTFNAIQCVAYMNGAFDAYKWATSNKCDLAAKNSNDLTKAFLYVYRHSPKSVQSSDARALVGTTLDICMCRTDLDSERTICPPR